MDIQDFDDFEDDLEVLELIEVGLPRRIYTRQNYIDTMNEWDFFKRFRLTKQTVMDLLILIEDRLEYPYDINNAVSPMNQLLCALRFYATGKHLLSVGDFAGMHTSTACRIVKRVSEAIALLLPQFVKFPTTENEILKAQREFKDKYSFPRVLGAIDDTHIKIQSPGGDDAEIFRNRKSFFSINVQGVSDANCKFINIVARWPGSTHDQTIFNNSNLRADIENNERNGILLGDSAYNLKSYLMTPILNPNGNAEQLYNESQIRSRGVVERMFGIWKRRFPILSYGSRLKLETTLTVIIATAVLHNIARDMNEEEPPPEEDEHILNELVNQGNIPNVPANVLNYNEAQNVRREFVNYFARLH